MAVPNLIGVKNHKGGVLKTQTVANLGVLASLLYGRTLIVDLDPQGNISRTLGMLDRSDGGEALAAALTEGAPLEVIRDVRPNLDVAAGGPAMDALPRHLYFLEFEGRESDGTYILEEALAPICDDYSWIIIDAPPGEKKIQAMIDASARWLLIPTQPDACSIDGLGTVCKNIFQSRATVNPDLEILGVFMGPIAGNGERIKRDARAVLDELGQGVIPILNTTIRWAQRPLIDYVDGGRTAVEDPNPKTANKEKGSLTSDYRALGIEVFSRLPKPAGTARKGDR